MDETPSDDACAPAVLAEMTSEIVAVYLSHNRVQPSDLPALIASVHATLARIGRSPEPAAAKPTRPMPIRKTLTDDHIISLEDGRPYKALKRHLAKLGLTPQTYREKWDLPLDYPMVAPAYARARSALAKETGLGSLRRREGLIDLPKILTEPACSDHDAAAPPFGEVANRRGQPTPFRFVGGA